MAMTAKVHFRFRMAARTHPACRAEVVRQADMELADVIASLPSHLGPEHRNVSSLEELDATRPWVKWQRFSVALVLLHCRMRMHWSLASLWRQDSKGYAWARTVAMESASQIIWISSNWDQPAEMRTQWYCYTLAEFDPS